MVSREQADITDEPGNAGATSDRAARHPWLEPVLDSILVAILTLATLVVAWSGYQAARWSGVQAGSYSQASAARIESARMSGVAQQLTLVDIVTFTNYVNALTSGDSDLADFYVQRFRPDFRPAFDAWMATDPLENPDAPSSPFVMPEYALPQTAQAAQLDESANRLFQEGEDANQHSDDYVLNTVFLAGVLLFTGIAPRIRWIPARLALTTISLTIFAVGLYNIVTFPVE